MVLAISFEIIITYSGRISLTSTRALKSTWMRMHIRPQKLHAVYCNGIKPIC